MKSGKSQFWRMVIIISVILFLFFSLVFVFLGRANDDEGYYLYASNIVFDGYRPYQDFSFTQMPLLPYVYGLFQRLFFPSIYLGRLTSVLVTALGFYLAIDVARKAKGEIAGGITALLWATFTYGIFFHSIVKTYPLITCFFIFAVFVQYSSLEKERKLILTSLFVVLASLTRLSAIFFAVPWLIYCYYNAKGRTKIIILSICSLAALWIFLLTIPNPDLVLWNLVEHHTDRWGEMTLTGKLLEIVKFRVPSVFLAFTGYLLLTLTILFAGYREIQAFLKKNISISVQLIAILFFVLPHFGTGGWYIEYFCTVLLVLFPILAILYVELLEKITDSSLIIRASYKAILIAALAIGFWIGSFNSFTIELSGRVPPIQDLSDLSEIIAKNSDKNDLVFAMSALDIVVEADRSALPGLSMAIFSYHPGNTEEARYLKLVNNEIIADYFEKALPKVVILTGRDWYLIEKHEGYQSIIHSLENQYTVLLKREDRLNFRGEIEIYIRQEK